jgi:glycine/D-amino acid oxidase-like deaminating enzyme
MRILLTTRLTPELEAFLLGDNVVYRPDLAIKGNHLLENALLHLRPDVLVAPEVPGEDVLRAWRAAAADHVPVVVALNGDEPRRAPAGVSVHAVPANGASREVEALALAERMSLGGLVTGAAAEGGSHPHAARDEVVVVGAGIVGLVTAHRLLRAGFRVTVLDAAPEPVPLGPWKAYGCTFGGQDARIFSFNEARHHHYKGGAVDAKTNLQFRRLVRDDGWLCCAPEDLGPFDEAWVEEFERVPQWLAGRFERDIVSFNVESHGIWMRLLETEPELFHGVGYNGRLLRTYPTAERFRAAETKERAIGSVLRRLEPAEVAEEFPSLAEAVDGGEVAGALEVVGFSLNVHALSRRLIEAVVDGGGTVEWDRRVDSIRWDERGRACGLAAGEEVVRADHYVLSPGAFGNELLRGTASYGRLAGVVGMWVTIPNAEPRLELPLKIGRSGYASAGAAEGANAIVRSCDGEELIDLSSGHGYVGVGFTRLRREYLDDLARAVDETACRCFPSKWRLAAERGLLDEERRYCVRPWTPTGLGVFEQIATDDGGRLIVATGHNTGGFAQAPSVAEAVLAAIAGEEHAMHALYHPRRFVHFAGEAAA